MGRIVYNNWVYFHVHSKHTWDNANLAKAMAGETINNQTFTNIPKWVESWAEQRLYPGYALAALDAPGASAATKALGAKISAEIKEQYPVT